MSGQSVTEKHGQARMTACVGGGRVFYFVGDSRVRNLYYAFNGRLDPLFNTTEDFATRCAVQPPLRPHPNIIPPISHWLASGEEGKGFGSQCWDCPVARSAAGHHRGSSPFYALVSTSCTVRWFLTVSIGCEVGWPTSQKHVQAPNYELVGCTEEIWLSRTCCAGGMLRVFTRAAVHSMWLTADIRCG
jgi:hypothetical protein